MIKIISRCRELRCQLCDKFNSITLARPTKMMRCRTLGKVVAMDFSFHDYHGQQFLVLHFVDEASRFHHATVVGVCPEHCTSERLVELIGQWTTFMNYPARWHVDSEGCFKGDAFIALCSKHNIKIAVCAGQAHWQNGMVERHIDVFKNNPIG